MKYLKICFITMVIGCNSTSKKVLDMPGAYLMVSQTINNGTTKTEYTSAKQLKIYTDKFMMYAQVLASDSTASFGVGSYTSDTGVVTENIFYSSYGNSFNDTVRSNKLLITKTPDGYTQVIPGILINNEKSKLTEVYQTVGKKQSSPLDGVWKQTKSYELKGADTSWYNRTEYKAFNNGYFMFGLTNKDSTGEITTGIGFGTFSMEGDNQIKETDLNSSYAVIAGQSFMIDIRLDGNDNYMQSITHSDSTKTVEFYERMKENK